MSIIVYTSVITIICTTCNNVKCDKCPRLKTKDIQQPPAILKLVSTSFVSFVRVLKNSPIVDFLSFRKKSKFIGKYCRVRKYQSNIPTKKYSRE
jgi:hypothetical protein